MYSLPNRGVKNSTRLRAPRSSSKYPMMKPSELSLSSTTSWAISTGSIRRVACGSRISAITCDLRMPMP